LARAFSCDWSCCVVSCARLGSAASMSAAWSRWTRRAVRRGPSSAAAAGLLVLACPWSSALLAVASPVACRTDGGGHEEGGWKHLHGLGWLAHPLEAPLAGLKNCQNLVDASAAQTDGDRAGTCWPKQEAGHSMPAHSAAELLRLLAPCCKRHRILHAGIRDVLQEPCR
jgi:hypothetical protein